MPVVPNIFRVTASAGGARAEAKMATEVRITNLNEEFFFIISCPTESRQQSATYSRRQYAQRQTLPMA
jgi:hypothetical protein